MAALGAVAPAAQAGVRGATIVGDFNADGIMDSAVLGQIRPNLCSTIVSYGTTPGVYLPPIAYTYLSPGGPSFPGLCPDIGVAANLDSDPGDELWVGWTQGSPPQLDFNRLVLNPPTFQPIAHYTSRIIHPVFVGVGVFGADGRQTPYSVGPGGVINYLVNGSTVVAGPINFCSVNSPAVELANWDRNGIDGMLVAYTDGCADGSNGVVLIRADGTTAQLELDPTGKTTWTARVVNANGDRFPDVRTINQTTGEVDYFINTGTGGEFFLVKAPKANSDRVYLTNTKAVAIDVLANDFVSRYVTVSITVPPRYGTVQVLSDKRIVYRPNPTHGRTDSFTYQLSEEGKHSSATVNIQYPD